MKKKIAAALLALGLLLLPYPAQAAQPLRVCLEGTASAPGQLMVHCNASVPELRQEQLSLRLAGEVLPISELRRFGDTGEAAAWLFIVDISGSIKQQQFEEIKEVLRVFAELLGARDSAAFMPLGDQLHSAPFVTGKKNFREQIEGLQVTREDTNLYAGLIQALDILQARQDLPAKKQVVVLSDGEDYFFTGHTREEVNEKVKAAHIPVHTIALPVLTGGSGSEHAKILGSFARISAGGLDLIYGLEGVTAQSLAETVAGAAGNSYVITADTSGLALKENGLLELTVNTGNETASDSLTLRASALVPPTTAPETTTGMPGEDPLPPIRWWIYAAGGGALLVTALLVLLLVLRKRKKASAAIENEAPALLQPQMPVPTPLQLYFATVGRESESYEFHAPDELVIGRNAGQAGFNLPEDARLSGRHCRVFWQNGNLYVEDLGSTNGTYLNGVPVWQPVPVAQDDILMAGSTELRVAWRR